jgi:NADPH-ferrihemoprotein reductase
MSLVSSFVTRHRALLRYTSTNRILLYPRLSSLYPQSWSRSSLSSYSSIRILYGSQGGTAQMFGMQLKEELESLQQQQSISNGRSVEILPLNDVTEDTLSNQELHVILVSVAGVGEPPDNARKFYTSLMERNSPLTVPYTIFGLGNSVAHPSNFNVIGKGIDTKLQALGSRRVHPMGLGDDGNCIEDDFDVWMEGLLKSIRLVDEGIEDIKAETLSVKESTIEKDITSYSKGYRSQVESNMRPNYVAQREPLQFQEHESMTSYPMNLKHTSFYQTNVQEMTVIANQVLSPHGGEQAIREICLELPTNVTYETGDHIILYPQNSSCMVDSILQRYGDCNPHAMIVDGGGPGYSKPTGISLYDTLMHTVDLGAVPSPSLARALLQKETLDYKQDIVLPHRTVLELLHMQPMDTASSFPLQDLLHMLPTMQPRYYSIASSSLALPNRVVLAYRPIKFVSKVSGHLREGVCTSYMSTLTRGSRVMAGIRFNPTFRLPQDPSIPMICIAGGCGVAPVRAFLEERLYLQQRNASKLHPKDNNMNDMMPNGGRRLGDAMLFLGFRSPHDQVYQDLVQESLDRGTLSKAFLSYSGGSCFPIGGAKCQLVSQTVRDHGDAIWDWIENRGAHVYLCGGARSFGAAVEAELVRLFQSKRGSGKEENDEEEAFQYLRKLISEGRLCEDLAD